MPVHFDLIKTVHKCRDCPYYKDRYPFEKNGNKPTYIGQTDLDLRPWCSKMKAVILVDVDREIPWWCK